MYVFWVQSALIFFRTWQSTTREYIWWKNILNKLTTRLHCAFSLSQGTRERIKSVRPCLLTKFDMEVLRLSRRILTVMGICLLPNGSSFSLEFGQMVGAILTLVMCILTAWYSALYCLEHYQMGDIDQNLFAVIQLVATVPTIPSLFSLIYRKANFRDYFDKIQTIFDKCNCGWNFIQLLPFEWIQLRISFQMKTLRLPEFMCK